MITRICISLNNTCNLNCSYCHFHTEEKKAVTKEQDMDAVRILDLYRKYIHEHGIGKFTIGYVGNGEPLLSWDGLVRCVESTKDLEDEGILNAYTVTNGILLSEERASFLAAHRMKVGISVDGPEWLHNKLRCNSFSRSMKGAENYRSATGNWPRFNATVGREAFDHMDEVIRFFESFGTKVTFSRMIGPLGITLEEYHQFLRKASGFMPVHTGGYDCTMYGGLCGAGMDNFYYANGKIWICGNCIDLDSVGDCYTAPADISLSSVEAFDRRRCFHEMVKGGAL